MYSCASRSPLLPVSRPSYLSSAITFTVSHHVVPSKCSAACAVPPAAMKINNANDVCDMKIPSAYCGFLYLLWLRQIEQPRFSCGLRGGGRLIFLQPCHSGTDALITARMIVEQEFFDFTGPDFAIGGKPHGGHCPAIRLPRGVDSKGVGLGLIA